MSNWRQALFVFGLLVHSAALQAQVDTCVVSYRAFDNGALASVPDSVGTLKLAFGPAALNQLTVADTLDQVVPPLAPPGGWYVALSNPDDAGLFWGTADARLLDAAPGTEEMFQIRLHPRSGETGIDSIAIGWSPSCFSPPGVTTLRLTACESVEAIVSDMRAVSSVGIAQGNVLWDDDAICLAIKTTDALVADARIFLEGPFQNGAMVVPPLFETSVPLSQPYSDAAFDGTALNFDSVQTATVMPDSAIDWVLVELRGDEAAGSLIGSSRHAAVLLSNGKIVESDGSPLQFAGVGLNGYRLVARHRNHLAVMSSDTLDLSDGIGSWDFTTGLGQAYSDGGDPMVVVGPSTYGLFAGDGTADGLVTAPDFNVWIAATTAGATGYRLSDFNLDGDATAPDFNLWSINTTSGAASQVPE